MELCPLLSTLTTKTADATLLVNDEGRLAEVCAFSDEIFIDPIDCTVVVDLRHCVTNFGCDLQDVYIKVWNEWQKTPKHKVKLVIDDGVGSQLYMGEYFIDGGMRAMPAIPANWNLWLTPVPAKARRTLPSTTATAAAYVLNLATPRSLNYRASTRCITTVFPNGKTSSSADKPPLHVRTASKVTLS